MTKKDCYKCNIKPSAECGECPVWLGNGEVSNNERIAYKQGKADGIKEFAEQFKGGERMRIVEFTIYSAGTQGKMIKTEDTEFSRLNTGLILNATLYNNMMRISTIVSVAGNLCTFKVGGQL